MKKAVAIPYIIALILGVIVLGLVGYWFVAQGGKTIGAGTKAECDAKIQVYCQKWKNEFLFRGSPPLSEETSCTMPNEIKPCLEKLGCKDLRGGIRKCQTGEVCYKASGGFCTGDELCSFAC